MNALHASITNGLRAVSPQGVVGDQAGSRAARRRDDRRGGPLFMWKTIGYLSLMCGTFIGLLITLAIVG